MDGDLMLVRAWQEGDAEAGDELVRRYFCSLYRFFRGKVDGDVEELVQRTLLGCVEALGRVRAELGFRPYLYGIARNQLFCHLRKERSASRRVEPLAAAMVDVDGCSADVTLVVRQQEDALLAALRHIPVDSRIAVELFYWEEMSVHQIASVLGVAPGTVKSRLARARDKLREQLEPSTSTGADDRGVMHPPLVADPGGLAAAVLAQPRGSASASASPSPTGSTSSTGCGAGES